MIEVQTKQVFTTSDNQVFTDLNEAKRHELTILFRDCQEAPSYADVGLLVANSDRIIDILTIDPGSRPKTRAIRGGRKPRKAKAETQTETITPATP